MESERRRYFRIDDQLALSLCLLTAEESEACLKTFWKNTQTNSIRNQYNNQIEHHLADFQKIKTTMPEMARYLSFLEKQTSAM